MSYDLEVLTAAKPESTALVAFVDEQAGLRAEGKLGDESEHLWVMKASGPEDKRALFSADGPFRVEVEDLAPAALEAVLAPRWAVQMSSPDAAGERGRKLMLRAAKELASQHDGAVFDPQADRVVWPPKSRRRPTRTVERDEEVRVLTLEWSCPAGSLASRSPEVLLGLLRRHLVEGLPRRYGTYEPLPHRLDREGEAHFSACWDSEKKLFWTSTHPTFSGSVDFPLRAWSPGEDRPQRDSLTLNLDARALEADERWVETTVRFFGEVAEELNAFFAAGYVERGHRWTGAQLVVTAEAFVRETVLLHSGGTWDGLPPQATWLTWFGGSYAPLVRAFLPDQASREFPAGLLVQLADRPAHQDELGDRPLRVPFELVAG